jgi:serine beta-lactamase-like protein LACTB, mitochondrial
MTYLTGFSQQKGTPAISVAVSLKGRLVLSAGLGFADLANLVPATGSTVFNIGSISKVNTAVAVMQLVEQGKVSLDDRIQKYVPGFPEKPEGPISIKHLMTHTSGVRHYRETDFPDSEDNESMRPLTWEGGLAIFEDDALLFRPGQYYLYSSYAVNLLQGVVEKASGVSFEAFMRRNVWGLAGMLSTSFDVPARIVPHRAQSYRLVDGHMANYFYNDLTYKFASGGMISTAEDLARLGAALNHGNLLKAETIALMYERHVDPVMRFEVKSPPQKLDFAQGLLWRVFKDASGRTFVNHCGTVKGFSGCLVNYSDDDVVVALLGNAEALSPGRNEALTVAQFFLPEPGTSRK